MSYSRLSATWLAMQPPHCPWIPWDAIAALPADSTDLNCAADGIYNSVPNRLGSIQGLWAGEQRRIRTI